MPSFEKSEKWENKISIPAPKKKEENFESSVIKTKIVKRLLRRKNMQPFDDNVGINLNTLGKYFFDR